MQKRQFQAAVKMQAALSAVPQQQRKTILESIRELTPNQPETPFYDFVIVASRERDRLLTSGWGAVGFAVGVGWFLIAGVSWQSALIPLLATAAGIGIGRLTAGNGLTNLIYEFIETRQQPDYDVPEIGQAETEETETRQIIPLSKNHKIMTGRWHTFNRRELLILSQLRPGDRITRDNLMQRGFKGLTAKINNETRFKLILREINHRQWAKDNLWVGGVEIPH